MPVPKKAAAPYRKVVRSSVPAYQIILMKENHCAREENVEPSKTTRQFGTEPQCSLHVLGDIGPLMMRWTAPATGSEMRHLAVSF